MLIEPIPKAGNSQVTPSTAQISPPEESQGIPMRKEADKEGSRPNLSQMRDVAADLQRNIKVLNNVDLQFSIHRSSGQVLVTVTDEDTGKVIREIPEREMLEIAARLEEMVGLVFDQTI